MLLTVVVIGLLVALAAGYVASELGTLHRRIDELNQQLQRVRKTEDERKETQDQIDRVQDGKIGKLQVYHEREEE
jgi:uncharacterized membrane-anchored protein YhcB (DUF1043 family)